MSKPEFEVFYVTSVKRENGKIVGVAAIQHRSIPPVRSYMQLSHVYHTQLTGRQFVFLIPFVVKEDPLELSAFRLKVKKENEEFLVVIPDTIEQRQGLASLPEYVRLPTDFI